HTGSADPLTLGCDFCALFDCCENFVNGLQPGDVDLGFITERIHAGEKRMHVIIILARNHAAAAQINFLSASAGEPLDFRATPDGNNLAVKNCGCLLDGERAVNSYDFAVRENCIWCEFYVHSLVLGH